MYTIESEIYDYELSVLENLFYEKSLTTTGAILGRIMVTDLFEDKFIFLWAESFVL